MSSYLTSISNMPKSKITAALYAKQIIRSKITLLIFLTTADGAIITANLSAKQLKKKLKILFRQVSNLIKFLVMQDVKFPTIRENVP